MIVFLFSYLFIFSLYVFLVCRELVDTCLRWQKEAQQALNANADLDRINLLLSESCEIGVAMPEIFEIKNRCWRKKWISSCQVALKPSKRTQVVEFSALLQDIHKRIHPSHAGVLVTLFKANKPTEAEVLEKISAAGGIECQDVPASSLKTHQSKDFLMAHHADLVEIEARLTQMCKWIQPARSTFQEVVGERLTNIVLGEELHIPTGSDFLCIEEEPKEEPKEELGAATKAEPNGAEGEDTKATDSNKSAAPQDGSASKAADVATVPKRGRGRKSGTGRRGNRYVKTSGPRKKRRAADGDGATDDGENLVVVLGRQKVEAKVTAKDLKMYCFCRKPFTDGELMVGYETL